MYSFFIMTIFSSGVKYNRIIVWNNLMVEMLCLVEVHQAKITESLWLYSLTAVCFYLLCIFSFPCWLSAPLSLSLSLFTVLVHMKLVCNTNSVCLLNRHTSLCSWGSVLSTLSKDNTPGPHRRAEAPQSGPRVAKPHNPAGLRSVEFNIQEACRIDFMRCLKYDRVLAVLT